MQQKKHAVGTNDTAAAAQHPAEKLAQWYATLSPSSLDNIGQYYCANAHFKDPFNDVQGLAAIEKIFRHMFSSTEQPWFAFKDMVLQEQQAFLSWEFHFCLRGKQYTILGGSFLRFDERGLVEEHRDYWDAAEELWQKLPLIGGIVRCLRGKFVAR